MDSITLKYIGPDRLENEKEHGRKIKANAEAVWGWTSAGGRHRAERRARYLYEVGKFKKGEKLLEIGCGTGLFTGKVFDATGANITAIDISEDLIGIARGKYPQIRFEVGDAMNLSFASNSFDGVYGSSVLHHLDMSMALQTIHRVLKPGQRVVFAEPNLLNPQIFLQKNVPFIKKMLGDSPDETAIVRWKMKRMMEETGFHKVNIFPYDFLHPYTPSFLIPFVNTIGKGLERIPVIKEIAGSVIIYGEKK